MTPRPILAALRSHRIAALLIVLEIALAFAIVSNALYLVVQRYAVVGQSSGLAERELVLLKLNTANKSQETAAAAEANLAALRAIPGVRAASLINSMPLSGYQWGLGYATRPMPVAKFLTSPEMVQTPIYIGDGDYLHTLGVRILQGGGLSASAYRTTYNAGDPISNLLQQSEALVTQAYAQRLWPHQSAVGKVMYLGPEPVVVRGVVSNILRPYIPLTHIAPDNHYGVILPFHTGSGTGWFVLRTTPHLRTRVLHAARAKLQALHPDATITDAQTYAQMRGDYFADTRALLWLLLGTVLALLAVTAVGIVGLASFWVQQRTRQIGMRRALGATRGDILRYFQTENFLLATAGIVLGCAAAIGINVWLMAHYAVPRLPVMYLPIGALALWLLGQLAVLGPALRAARVPPTVAMRMS